MMKIFSRPVVVGATLIATILAAGVSALELVDRAPSVSKPLGRTPVSEPWQLEHEQLFEATSGELRHFIGAWCIRPDRSNPDNGIRVVVGSTSGRPYITATMINGFALTDTLNGDPIYYPARAGRDGIFFEVSEEQVWELSRAEDDSTVLIAVRGVDESGRWAASSTSLTAKVCD